MEYIDILNSTTKILNDNFACDIFQLEANEGLYNSECFVVDIIPVSSEAYNYCISEKSLIISIKYFSNEKLKHIETSNKLEKIFYKNIKVNDIKVEVSKLEPNFLNDGIGDYLDFLIYINIYDNFEQKQKEEEINQEYPSIEEGITITIPYEIMQEVKINN